MDVMHVVRIPPVYRPGDVLHVGDVPMTVFAVPTHPGQVFVEAPAAIAAANAWPVVPGIQPPSAAKKPEATPVKTAAPAPAKKAAAPAASADEKKDAAKA